MNNETNQIPIVGVATGSTRSKAVANALALVRDDILSRVGGTVLIKPNFLSSTCERASTQADAVRPVLELLRDSKAKHVEIAEGGSRSTGLALDNFGYRGFEQEFDVSFVDLNREPFTRSFNILATDGSLQKTQYADRVAKAGTVISIPVAKTHDTAMVTLSIKNMMGCLRRVHRPRMHGIRIGDTIAGAAERVWNVAEGHPAVIKSFSGAVFTIVNNLRGLDTLVSRGKRTGLARQAGAMAENICRLAAVLMPDIAVIDAFEAMEGNGPGSAGTPVDMRVAVAGIDPVACDAVMAFMMGFDPMTVGYLVLAHERGLGTAEMDEIQILGEDPACLARHFRPHRNHDVQRRWREVWGEIHG